MQECTGLREIGHRGPKPERRRYYRLACSEAITVSRHTASINLSDQVTKVLQLTVYDTYSRNCNAGRGV